MDFSVIVSHWPFVAAALVLGIIGEVTKRVVAPKGKSDAGWRWWFRVTMPVHPVLTGGVLGLVPGVPVSVDASSIAARCLYFAGAGVVSTWVYGGIKHFLEARGVKVAASIPPPSDAPGEDTKP